MKLPNAENAIVDIEKFTEYCLNVEHPSGRHKAYVFKTVLGLTLKDAAFLQETVRQVAGTHDAELEASTPHGQRYVIDFEMTTETAQRPCVAHGLSGTMKISHD